MKFPISFAFNGKLINDENEECPTLVLIEYDKYDPSEFSCTLTTDDGNVLSGFLDKLSLNPRIVGELPNGRPILIRYGDSSSTTYSTGRTVAALQVNDCIIGPSGALPFEGGEELYAITLLSAPAVAVRASTYSSYLGEVNRKRSEDDSISWETEEGHFNIANYYELDTSQIGLERADVQIEFTKLILRKKLVALSRIDQAFIRVEEQVKDLLTILSLINRKFIQWRKIEATFRDELDDNKYLRSEKRRTFSPYRGSRREPLFVQSTLKQGHLYSLLMSYRKSEMKSAIEKAITYLAASYELDRLEPKLLMAYSAFESIVNNSSGRLGISRCLSDKQFKDLKHKLINAVDVFCEDESSHGKKIFMDDIKEKLSEIKTRPLRNRVIDIIKRYAIDCSDIWDLPADDLEEIIQAIIGRRNKLIHDVKRADPDFFYPDLVRIRALCERLILAELGFKDYSLFWALAYRELRMVRNATNQ